MIRIEGNPRPTGAVNGTLNEDASDFVGGKRHQRVQIKINRLTALRRPTFGYILSI